jgi:hypothetical protein
LHDKLLEPKFLEFRYFLVDVLSGQLRGRRRGRFYRQYAATRNNTITHGDTHNAAANANADTATYGDAYSADVDANADDATYGDVAARNAAACDTCTGRDYLQHC